MWKPLTRMTFEERKSELISRCFIEMADLDYLTARWAYNNGIFHNFCWSAAQCVEKYIKAALLYNGFSTIGLRHDLEKMQLLLESCHSTFFETRISMPKTTGRGRDRWHDKNFGDLIKWLNKYGSADVRYSLNDTHIDGPIIHPLDTFCAAIRRFIRLSNFMKEDLLQLSQQGAMPHEKVYDVKDWMINGDFVLEMLYCNRYRVGHGEELRVTFRNMNFAFFDERDIDEKTFGGEVYSMSPILNHLRRLRHLDKGTENSAVIDLLEEWVKKNVELGSLKAQLNRVQ